jgi:nitrate reductase (cytochrome), electron transfer subunit
MNEPRFSPHKRAAWIFGAILLTAAVSGYFMGLQQTASHISRTRPVSLVAPDPERVVVLDSQPVPVAVEYARQNWLRDGINAGWHNHLTNLVSREPEVPTEVTWTEADRLRVLDGRADFRAYDGAPPVVPHPITQSSAASCLACHGPGLVVQDRVASRMSHAHLMDCTQCHVPAEAPLRPLTQTALLDPLTDNTFAGLTRSGAGARAWPQAPPTIPHSTFMRGDCLSCHGPLGAFALRTTHPERQSCTQCHVPDASLDQYDFLPGLFADTFLSTLKPVAPRAVAAAQAADSTP